MTDSEASSLSLRITKYYQTLPLAVTEDLAALCI